MENTGPKSMRTLHDLLRVLREQQEVDEIRYSSDGYLDGDTGVYLYRAKPRSGFGGLTLCRSDFLRLMEVLHQDNNLRNRRIRLVGPTGTTTDKG